MPHVTNHRFIKPGPVLALLHGIAMTFAVLLLWFTGLAAEEIEHVAASYRIEAQHWNEAEKIFRTDLHWLGGDGASTIDLGKGRVLWLFGDSFIDPSGAGSRKSSDIVRNSLAIQTGYDPLSASMKFYWSMQDGRPAAFFARNGKNWFWPASGIMLGRHLLVFLMEIETAENQLGFDACGWKAVWISNPQEEPDKWNMTYLISPQMKGLVVGSCNPILEKGFLTVCASDSRDRSVYLVRWPKHSALNGTLTDPQWWAGYSSGWVRGHKKKIERVITEGQMEFTLQYQPGLERYIQVQTLSLMNPCLAMASASSMTGPWSAQACFHTPREQGSPELLIYAGKSHPMLKGADMVFTYVVNTTKEDRLLNDMSIYFPVMLKGRIVEARSVP